MRIEHWLRKWHSIIGGAMLTACTDPSSVTAPDTHAPAFIDMKAATQTTTTQECAVSPATASVRVATNGGTVKIKLTVPRSTCANYRLKTEDGTSWARVTSTQPVKGTQTISISVAKNTGAERTVRMVITNLGGTKVLGRFTLVQTGVPCAGAKLTESRIDAGSEALTTSIALTASKDCKWQATADAAHLTVRQTSGTGGATITVSAGTTTVSRTGRVTVTDASTKAIIGTFQVTQTVKVTTPDACVVTLRPTSLAVAKVGATESVQATFVSGTCTVRMQPSVAWLTVSAAELQRTASLTVTASANTGGARLGTISLIDVTSGRTLTTLAVSQAGSAPELSTCTPIAFTTATLQVADTAHTVTTTLSTPALPSCTGTISANESWAVVSPTTFRGTTSIRITVGANTSTSSTRSVTITARASSGAIDRLTIVQAAKPVPCTISLKSTTTSFATGGGLANIDMTRASTCSTPVLAVSHSWLTATIPSANVLRVSAAANTGEARTGEVRVLDPRTGAVLARLVVQQAAVPVVSPVCNYTVSPVELRLSTAFHNYEVRVTPSHTGSDCASWSVTSNESWLSIFTPYNYNGSASIRGSVQANATVTPRAGTLTIRGAGGTVKVITVSQDGHSPPQPDVDVSPRQLDLKNGYQQVPLQVTTAATTCYEVLESVSWLNVPGGTHLCGSKTVTLYVDFNSGAARSAVVQVGGTAVVVTQAGTR